MTKGSVVKFAVTLFGSSILTFCGLVVPVKSPLHSVNVYPVFAIAVQETTVFASYESEAGVIVPLSNGETAVVRKYCVFQFQVIEEFCVIVNWHKFVSPVADTEPVPVQPAQT
jgi:hypothetical protein